MSLHWTLIAGFLYGEIVVVLLFLLPFVSNRAWSKLFKSNFLKGIENQFIYYFYILVAILVLFFLGKLKKGMTSPFSYRLSWTFLSFQDAIREMQKYSDDPTEGHSHGTHLDAQVIQWQVSWLSHFLVYLVKVKLLVTTPTQFLICIWLIMSCSIFSDANAHALVQGPAKLLHFWLCSVPLLGHPKNGYLDDQ